MRIAKKSDWNISEAPVTIVDLPVPDSRFTEGEFSRIKVGFVPTAMEDKWFIYFDNDILSIHRSWTGILMYQVKFQHAESVAAIRDIKLNTSVYKKEGHVVDLNYESKMVDFLMRAILLGQKELEMPLDPNVQIKTGKDYWLHRHAVVGNTKSNEDQLLDEEK